MCRRATEQTEHLPMELEISFMGRNHSPDDTTHICEALHAEDTVVWRMIGPSGAKASGVNNSRENPN